MKKLWKVFISVCMIFGLVACGGSGSSSQEKSYVTRDEIPSVFKDPNAYKGKYIKLSGKIFNKSGDGYQIWQDPVNSENDFYVIAPSDEFQTDDYVKVDGRIDGVAEGTNAFGGQVSVLQIGNAKMEKSSYIDIVVPTKTTLEPKISQEQSGITVSVEKVEFAEKETRVYMTVKNDSSADFDLSNYDIKILQDGKQIEQDDSSMSRHDGKYPELPYEIVSGVSTEGILVFPVLDAEKDFQIIAEGWTQDTYEELRFTLDVKAK